jgi:uncharacterized protein (DUF433 family)
MNSIIKEPSVQRASCAEVAPHSAVQYRYGPFQVEDQAMNSPITIVDHGRGPQLSTSRVTVQDLVPYFQEGCSYEEIIRWIPTLTTEEIAVVDRYYRQHQAALDEEDRLIRERSTLNKNPPWVEKLLEEARIDRLAITERLRQQANGEAN